MLQFVTGLLCALRSQKLKAKCYNSSEHEVGTPAHVHSWLQHAAASQPESSSCIPFPRSTLQLCLIVRPFCSTTHWLFSHQMNYSAADCVLVFNNSSNNTSCSESPFKSVLETLLAKFFHNQQCEMGLVQCLEKRGSALLCNWARQYGEQI